MNLVIHDLDEKEWNRISGNYDGWEVISDNGSIRPCVGCFGCWLKTPGECVIKDGYNKMGELIHKAGEVVVITRYTYGGFSSFVKNVFDRSISWVLPFFEIVDGEMHHKSRYPESKKITFVFRGAGLTQEDKADAKRYLEAVCRNFHGEIADVRFEECARDEKKAGEGSKPDPARTVLLNGSLRGDNANTRKFLEKLSKSIDGNPEIINLSSYLNTTGELLQKLEGAGRLVLGIPMYVDGIPSAILRVMEEMKKNTNSEGKKIYVVANMGFYEPKQMRNLLKQVRKWCDRCGYTYCGAAAIGAGEMMGQLINVINGANGPIKNVVGALETLAGVISTSSAMEDIYAGAYRFPRAAYMFMANSGWPKSAKTNGIKKKDLFRR